MFQKLRGTKRKFFVEKKPNIAELNWYKKKDTLYHYGDVGYLAKQIGGGTTDEVYSKIIQDRENSKLSHVMRNSVFRVYDNV